MKVPILLPEKSAPSLDSILQAAQPPFAVADFAPRGVEGWTLKAWGWQHPSLQVDNIDHHGENPAFFRRVSSGTLAAAYIAQHGFASDVVLNHADCDSVSAAGILLGHIEPLPAVLAAVIAADHTGEENVIADVLQEGQDLRDYLASLRWLRECLEGRLSPEATRLRDTTR